LPINIGYSSLTSDILNSINITISLITTKFYLIIMKFTSFLGALAAVQAVNAGESVYVVNSRKGNEVSSGFAYYADNRVSPWGRQPDAYTDVTHGSLRVWEGKRTTGMIHL
jgi:hypothetical protein